MAVSVPIGATNFRAFKTGLEDFAKTIDTGVSVVKRAYALDIARGTLLAWPVRTGRSVNSWQAAYYTPNLAVMPEGFVGTRAMSMGKLSVLDRDPDPYAAVWWTINLAYAPPLEYGHSQQAPTGALRNAIAAADARVEAERRRRILE